MPLPELIEIVPLDKPVQAEITVPGSKSITNRALILAALAHGNVTLQGALWSEDTQIMVEALRKLGFEINVEPDPEEFCNRTITVRGLGGRIPNAGTPEKPLELFVGNAGTAARFLAAMVCLGLGSYRLHGTPRMHERPQAALFKALRELGYRVDSLNDKLPATLLGGSSRRESAHASPTDSESRLTSAATSGGIRSCTVSIEESSQFASALLLCAKQGGWNVKVTGENAEESPYVAMTSKLIDAFPCRGGRFQIEPDASSGSYFLAFEGPSETLFDGHGGMAAELSSIQVKNWPRSGWQIDERFDDVFRGFRKGFLSRRDDLGDSIMTAIVREAYTLRWRYMTELEAEKHRRQADMLPRSDKFRFADLGRLRLQECDRVTALRTELAKCGAKVVEEGDTLTVYPSELHGAEIETYNDHRIAMCFAILGLKVPGIRIKNPACVKKTFPNFFQKLAGPPPQGLGAEIRDAKTGRKLEADELFAD